MNLLNINSENLLNISLERLYQLIRARLQNFSALELVSSFFFFFLFLVNFVIH